MNNLTLEVYVVRNRDGYFYRSKGYGGYGPSWVETVDKAHIYTKIASARRAVSYWSSAWPDYGVPEIVVLRCAEIAVLDESERIKVNAVKRKKCREEQEVRDNKRALKEAQDNLTKAQERLGKPRNSTNNS